MSRGNAETKTAMTELVGELDRTRKEFAKAAMQVTQLETQLQSCRDDIMRKDQRVLSLESELHQKEERHRQMVNTMEEDFSGKELAWMHRIKTLEVEVTKLQAENQAVLQLERENRQLRDTMLENQTVLERLQAINDDLRNKAKDDAKDQSSFLEAEFRKRLADSEKKFRAEAYRALSEEAKLALQGNDHLQTVLQRQNDSIEAVLLRCKSLENSHSKIQQEQDANLQEIQSHVAEIQRLKRQLADAKSKGAVMDEAMKQRRVERASLELLFVEYETTRKQLAHVKEKYRRAQRESERWRSRAVQLTHELDDEQREAAEAKLSNMQAQSETIEAHLERRRQREMRRTRVKESNADGAQALRQAEQASAAVYSDDGGSDNAAWDGLSEDEEEGPSMHTGGAGGLKYRTIDPMEILAMWNVNFDTWRAPNDPNNTGDEDRGRSPSGKSPTTGFPAEAISDVPETSTRQSQQPAPQQSQHLQSANTPTQVQQQPTPPGVSGSNGGRGGVGSNSMTVAQRQTMLDQKLSVLSQPKPSSIPPGARYYAKGGRKPLEMQRAQLPPLQELNTVSNGEFKVAKRTGGTGGSADSSSRFLVP